MEAEKKPIAKPRKKQTALDDLGPPPPLPTHRMFKPFTDKEISSVIAKAPDAVNSEIGESTSFQSNSEKIDEIVEDESSTSINENIKNNGLNIEIDHDYEDIVESKIPKSEEKPITPTSRVTEQPLTVLLPKETSPPPVPPRQVYPKLTSISSATDIRELDTPKFESVFVEPLTFSEAIKYPKIRPDVAESSFVRTSSSSLQYFKEAELLTEGQLLDYYQNEQLDSVDDFVDTFVEQQLNPHNALFDLLLMYKDVCEKLQLTNDSKQVTVANLTRINNEVWIIEEKVVNETGRCGDDRAASGSANYKEAKFIATKIIELKEKLLELSQRELDEAFCQEIRARSLALQIQWTVVMINNEFLVEVKTGATAMPTLLSTNHISVKRNQLRGTLSDLFYFLRFPLLPKRFSDSVYAWIIELTSVLYKSCTIDDQMFILCQILRTPSPVTPWGTQLIQTFILIPSLDATKPIDNFLALLALAVQSPRMREQFLNRIQKYYDGDNSWNVISDDGDTDNTNLMQMNEIDLVAIFGQFDVKALFLVATRHFSFISRKLNDFGIDEIISETNKRQIMLSLIAFTLVVTKLLDEGLKTYASLKNVCKKLASNIRSLCQNLCSFWDIIKSDFQSQIDQRMIQNEINRIVLQSMYYIVSKKSAGLWQFLVDFPFSSVTEYCRQRCQLLLRSPKDYTVAKLYEISDESLSQCVKTAGSLVDRLLDVGKDEHFMLSALAAIISKSENDLGFYVNEMIRVCFLDEVTRENYYKVGSEAMAILIEKCPKLLSSILNFIDRNVDHLDQYAIDILTNASLKDCVLSKEDVEAKLAKWLINRPIEHPANHIARRVLTSVNWGSTGQLWMPQEVHEACADAIVKAHIVKCKTRNSLIAKSYKKAANMATKCPDLEHQFDKFCWDVLIRLKFVSKPALNLPQNDLTAFFVYLMQKCLITADIFLDNGTKPFHELVNASCFIPAVVFLSRLVTTFPSKIPTIIQNETFRECVDWLLHADESSYALQLLMGADKFPGPVLKMLLASISHNLTISFHHLLKDLVVAWLQVVTCKKTVEWNMDKPVLCVIGMIVGIAIEKDSENLFGLTNIIMDIYRNQLTVWRENSKGIMSWFSTQIPPPLLPSNLMSVSPWASFILLLAEPKVHIGFYSNLYIGLQKHSQRPLEEHVKKASSKSHVNLTIERLDYFRWLELANCASTNHPAYPLICQQLCTVLFERKSVEKKMEKLCPGEMYFKCPNSTEMFNTLRNDILSKAEKNATNEKLRSFYHAVSQWLFTEALYKPSFTRFSDLILDYFVQMIIADDRHYWIDLIQLDKIHSKIQNEAKLFSTSCHLENIVTIENRIFERKFTSSTEFFNFLQIPSTEIVGFPIVPMHEGLPTSDGLSFTDCCSPQYVLQKFASYVDDVGRMSKTFIDGKENINSINVKYLELFGKLYHTIQTTLIISLKCGNIFSSKCPHPSSANVVVSASQYDTNIAAQMNENRQKREEEVAKLITMLDVTAIKSAHAEFIARTLNLYGYASKSHSIHFDKIKITGKAIFYHICQSVTTANLLFPAATDAYIAMMRCLGSIFIANQAIEQFNIMQLVLSGSPLSHFLYEHFTPHCVPADQLLQLYSELSRCVRNQTTATASLELLKRLDIQHAGDQMPPNQFSYLMPIIFENLISANGTNSALAKLCCDHFVHALFHHFPLNFVNGFAQLLCGADTQGLPAEIFDTISDQLEMNFVISENRLNITKCSLNSQISLQCIQVLSAQLVKSRRELTTRLFAVWSPYLGHICKFAEFFIKSYVSQTFNSTLPPTVMENELRNVFNLVLSIWNPLLEPINNGLAPWSPSDQSIANFVIEKFIRILIWLPHSTYLPPGNETIESLFWEHFSSRLMALQKAGTAHVYPLYEEKIIVFKWQRFWPTLLGISAMDNLLTEGAPEIGPLVTEIFVRIPWQEMVQHQQNQPIEAHKAFHSLLLSLLCRCSYRSANYAKSRASVERLQAALLNSCQWYYVKADVIEKLGSFIISHYPNDTLTIPNDVIKTFFNIWRQTCFFSTTLSKPPVNAGDVEIIRKQATYLRTDFRLMLKTNWQIADMQKHLREMLTKVDLIVGGGDKTAYIHLAKELTSFLIEIPKDKTTHSLVKTLGEWFRDHPESSLVLLIMHTTMQSMANSNPQLGLKLLNKCLKAYFYRKISCDWLEVCQWLSVPQRSTEWLYTTPDTRIKPYFLILNAHLIQEMSNLQSVQDEIALLKRLHEYLMSIKPKYIKTKKESSYLLCLEKLQRMVIRQYSNGVSTNVANEHLENYLVLLKKIHSDEKSGSIFSFFGKKTVFPIKLQLFSQIIYLFVSQQQVAPGQPPRLQSNQAVLNSRIQAFKELQNNKQFSEFANVLQFSSPFFTQVESYCLTNVTNLFAKTANLFYPNDKSLNKLDI